MSAAVSEEAKSVTWQIEHAKAYATRKGWTVADDCLFSDDNISGAEFATRPDFLRLMNALKPHPKFQVLIMSEESRLGRESIETAYALMQLVTAGVRVFFYLEDRERTLDSRTDKLMLSVTAFADELEREKARQRTYDAMLRKARAGQVTGGRVFGYDNIDIMTPGPDGQPCRSHVERRINESEAAVIRRIFELCGQGHGLRAIAVALNADGAVCPRPQQQRPKGWAPSSVRAILYRPLYRGEIVWNRTKKRNQWGIKEQRSTPEAEWLRLSAPELRIVSDDLWNAAHARLAGSRETYVRGTGGRLWGRPPNGVASKYLLSGLARCGQCGGSIIVRTRASGRKRTAWYACSSYHVRGRTVCTNHLEVPLEAVDAALFDMLEADVLSTDVLEDVTRRVVDQLKALAAQPTDIPRDELERERSLFQLEVARLTSAIVGGGDVPSLVAALREREARLAGLTRELEVLTAPAHLAKTDRRMLERQVRARLTEWRSSCVVKSAGAGKWSRN
ncbi:MAG: hypothetical protein GEV06_09320 [Luteitalea sp.]|nr:hypothetical protein [Luteitalea sp.]